MPRNYQYKKRNSSDSSDTSAPSEVEKCVQDGCYDQSRACIVCPPCDYKEKYDSSGSDRSCPDFSQLCEDKPRICSDKKYSYKKHESSESSDSSDSSDSSCDLKFQKKQRGCGCLRCGDYDRSSILKALGSSESESDCANFDRIACDEKRKCDPLFIQNKGDSYSCDDTKDASCVTKDNKKQDTKRCCMKRGGKRNGRKPLLKEKSSSSSSSSSSSRGKKFIVSFGPKEGHQWAKYNNGDESIHINGKNGPVLHLYRGSTYFFCVEQSSPSDDSSCDSESFFFLTDSPSGGSGSKAIKGGFAPVSKGCVCFKVDKCTPRYFFYQSSRHAFEGGLVIVHDK